MKLTLVLRTDLGLSTGKVAVQAAHAAVLAVAAADSFGLQEWREAGQPKIALRVSSEEELMDYAGRARDAGLPVVLVHDAGRSQVAPGTVTAAAIGPAGADAIDRVCSGLHLL